MHNCQTGVCLIILYSVESMLTSRHTRQPELNNARQLQLEGPAQQVTDRLDGSLVNHALGQGSATSQEARCGFLYCLSGTAVITTVCRKFGETARHLYVAQRAERDAAAESGPDAL
jgi:hypothetical protein